MYLPFSLQPHLSEMILRHTGRLSQTLQYPDMSSVEGHKVARLRVKFLQVMRSNRDFDLLWDKIEMNQSPIGH